MSEKFSLKWNDTTNQVLYYMLGKSAQSILDSFLTTFIVGNIFQYQIAQKLELEGLLDVNNKEDHEEKILNMLDPKREYHQPQPVEERKIVNVDQSITTRRHSSRASTLNNLSKFDVGSMTPEEIVKKTEELYEKKDGVWSCMQCEYTTSINKSTMKNHLETHLQGLSYTCTYCSKEFRSFRSLQRHKSNFH